MQKRVVITGAAGFIGSHLSDALLDRGYAVVGIDNLLTGDLANIAHIKNRDFEFIKHDVTNYINVEGPVYAVLHWASPASPIDYLELPIPTLKVGALGTHKALGLAKAKGARFVIASTSEVYGDPLEHPQKETYWGNVNPIGPRGVYDEAKRFAEAMTTAYHRYHGLDAKIVRIFNTYGPRMRVKDGRAVPAFMSQALRNEDVTVFGDGSQTRSFCYVSDLVDGIIRMMESSENSPINIGRDDHPPDRRDHHRDDRLDEPHHLPAAARGRPEGAPPRHHPRPHAARLGAEGRPARRAHEDHRLLPHEGAVAVQTNGTSSAWKTSRRTFT
jgi:dTDP-glucose 4,6-dehydratase